MSKIPTPNTEHVDIIAFLIKLTSSIGLGLMAVVSYTLTQKRNRSYREVSGILGLSIFVGVLAGLLCDYLQVGKMDRVIISLATLFGEKIFEIMFDKFGTLFRKWALDNLAFWKKTIEEDGENNKTKSD